MGNVVVADMVQASFDYLIAVGTCVRQWLYAMLCYLLKIILTVSNTTPTLNHSCMGVYFRFIKMNSEDAEQYSPSEATDDSCRFQYIEIVPLTGDTDGACTTECDNGDWSAEVKQENLPVVKQELDDVCCIV